MLKKIVLVVFLFISLIPCKLENVYAADRVVVKSLPSDLWYENIYLLADKLSWMDYKNFTLQIGDKASHIYNFPNWYSGKYDIKLLKEDINDDTEEDIIIVLNNDLAEAGMPVDEIHILNKIIDPDLRYEEAPIEPIKLTTDRLIKMKQHGDTVTVTADKRKYNVHISKYNYSNSHSPYVGTESIEYSIKKGKLIGTIVAYVFYDAVTGGIIGKFDIQYQWDGKMYKAKSILFRNYFPKSKKLLLGLD
jgi:hypothetical protein